MLSSLLQRKNDKFIKIVLPLLHTAWAIFCHSLDYLVNKIPVKSMQFECSWSSYIFSLRCIPNGSNGFFLFLFAFVHFRFRLIHVTVLLKCTGELMASKHCGGQRCSRKGHDQRWLGLHRLSSDNDFELMNSMRYPSVCFSIIIDLWSRAMKPNDRKFDSATIGSHFFACGVLNSLQSGRLIVYSKMIIERFRKTQ